VEYEEEGGSGEFIFWLEEEEREMRIEEEGSCECWGGIGEMVMTLDGLGDEILLELERLDSRSCEKVFFRFQNQKKNLKTLSLFI
jgi:hypothetical protein